MCSMGFGSEEGTKQWSSGIVSRPAEETLGGKIS